MANRQYDYDIIILGGGSAGIVSGVMAGALGMRVLLIEKAKIGGECLTTGCVPSKALLHAAKVAHTLRTTGGVGFTGQAVTRTEAAKALEFVRRTIETVRDADATEALLHEYQVELRFGSPHFAAAHTLSLDGSLVTAENVILATGSHPAEPDIPGLKEVGFRTNQTIFDLEAIPRRLLIVGGGPVGVEMAQAFQRLGSQVTLVQKGDRLLPRDDGELSAELERILRAEGVDIRLNTTLQSVRREKGRIVASGLTGFHHPPSARDAETQREAERTLSPPSPFACDEILVAVGRAPNVAGLNLEAAGVVVEKQGVRVDDALRTTAPHIYACGDILGRYQFSHLAEYEAKLAVRNIVFPGTAHTDFRIAPWTTFTDPELAHVGLTEEEAQARGIAYEVYRQPFGQNDRALTEGEGQGLVKVLTRGLGGKILGVQILGPCAGELIQEWVLAMQQGHGIRTIADLIHVYPTLSMANQHVAQRWYQRKAQEPLIARSLETYTKVLRPHRKAIALGVLSVGLLGAGFGLAHKLTSKS